MLREGHTFSIHVVDPIIENNQQQHKEKAIAKHISFTAVLKDGFSLSYSNECIKQPIHKEPISTPLTPRLDQSQVSIDAGGGHNKPTDEAKEKQSSKKTSKKTGKKDATPEPTVSKEKRNK